MLVRITVVFLRVGFRFSGRSHLVFFYPDPDQHHQPATVLQYLFLCETAEGKPPGVFVNSSLYHVLCPGLVNHDNLVKADSPPIFAIITDSTILWNRNYKSDYKQLYTVRQRNFDTFYIVTYHIKWVKTFWTDGMYILSTIRICICVCQ